MDSYIKDSKSRDKSDVWWSDTGSKSQKDAVSPMAEMKHNKFSSDEIKDNKFLSDVTGEVPVFKPFKPSNAMFAPESNNAMFAPEPSHSMSSGSDALVARPYHSSSQSNEGGGAVVNVKLDSELQESLLQSRQHGRSKTNGRTNSAPNVEAAVESERLEDVYIHDEFSQEAADDAKKEQEVNANRDMRAAA